MVRPVEFLQAKVVLDASGRISGGRSTWVAYDVVSGFSMSYAGQAADAILPFSNALVDLPPISLARRRLTCKAPHWFPAEIMNSQSTPPQELPSQVTANEGDYDQPGVTEDGKINWDNFCSEDKKVRVDDDIDWNNIWSCDEQLEACKKKCKPADPVALARNSKRSTLQ